MTQQLMQCRSNFFVRHRENLKQHLLMKIQNKKLLQMMEFSNILINLEEPIGYPAHTGLISPSVYLFVRPSGIQKTYILIVGIKIKKSCLSVISSLRIPIPMLLYCKLVSNTKKYFPPQPKNCHNGTSHIHRQVHPLLHVGWRNFFYCLRKVPPAQAQRVFEVIIWGGCRIIQRGYYYHWNPQPLF